MNTKTTDRDSIRYDVLLSFRRKDGEKYIHRLRMALEEMGYSIFVNDEDFDNGPFYGGSFEAIEKTPLFIAILTPGYFGLARGQYDWVMESLRRAIESSRTILFINPEDTFEGFPEDWLKEFSELTTIPVLNMKFGDTFRQSVNILEAHLRKHIIRKSTRSAPIFISYARADKVIVSRFVEKLEKDLRINCWNDLEDIESGEQFEEVIMRAIDASRIVLFMLSENALNSAWTKREVYYAEGEGKKIVPIIIDGEGLRGWFKFHFGNVDFIDINSNEHYKKLLSNLHEWLRITPSHFGLTQGHEWVDLGTGVKWALSNIGAKEPEDIGDFYSWGEIEAKQDFSWPTYAHGLSDKKLTKYVPRGREEFGIDGFSDGLILLDVVDDVAQAAWGNQWRIPTKDDFKALIEACDRVWTKRNGRSGYLLTSRINGEQLFLPASGSITDTLFEDRGSIGRYWSANVDSNDPYFAWSLFFNSDKMYSIFVARCVGLSIRPVTD